MFMDMKYFNLEALLASEVITAENVVTILKGGEEAEAIIALLLKSSKITVGQADSLLHRVDSTPVVTYTPPQPLEHETPYFVKCGCTVCNCTLGGWQTTCSAAPGPSKK